MTPPAAMSPETAAAILRGFRLAHGQGKVSDIELYEAHKIYGFPSDNQNKTVAETTQFQERTKLQVAYPVSFAQTTPKPILASNEKQPKSVLGAFPGEAVKNRVKQWCTGSAARQRGDVPSGIRTRNTNRAHRYLGHLARMQAAHGPLLAVTLYPDQQPATLAAAQPMLKALAERIGKGKDVLAVARFDLSGRFHIHAAVPLSSFTSGCPCGSAVLWERTTWVQHDGNTGRGWQCPACKLTFRVVRDLKRWAAYLGGPADELVWKDPERAAGRWLLAVDALGYHPRLSHRVSTPAPSAAWLDLRIAVGVLLAPAPPRPSTRPRPTRPAPTTPPRHLPPYRAAQPRPAATGGQTGPPVQQRERSAYSAPLLFPTPITYQERLIIPG